MARLLVVLLATLLFSARLAAQSPATLTGTVLDPSGAVIARAQITASPMAPGGHATARTTSDAEGRFTLTLPAGSYRIEILHPPFARYEQEVHLAADERHAFTARLALDRTSARVIVTPENFPEPAETIAAPSDVITAEDIHDRQALTLAEALIPLSGVSIGQGGRMGGPVSLFLDGGNSNYTKVLVDGAPLNTPGGAVDLSLFTLDNVSKIEVVHGAESALYGSDAMTGVVQIFTAQGATRTPEFILTADGGNFATGHGSAVLRGLLGRFDYAAAFAYFDTAGQGVNNGFLDRTLSGNFGWKFTDSDWLRLALRDNTSNARIQGQTLITPPELDEFNALNNFNATLSGQFSTGTHWQHSVSVTESYAHQVFDNPASSFFLSPDPSMICTGMPRAPKAVPSAEFCDFTFSALNSFNRVDADAHSTYLGRKATITAGYFYEVENGYLSDIGSHARRNNLAGYLEARYQFTERLTATAGVRAEDNSNFGTRVVPRLGAAYLVRRGGRDFGATRLHAAYGLGIKEPSLDESFGTSLCFPGNPDLRPERSTSVHGGVDQFFWGDRIHASVDGFYNRFHDLISFGEIATPPPVCGGFAGTYFNTDLARAAGTSFNLEAKAARWLRIATGYAYDDTRVLKAPNATDPAEIPGNRLLRRPLNSGTISLIAGYRRWSASLIGYYSGSRTDSDFLGLGFTRTPPYATFDFATRYDLGRGLEVFARVQNLLDRQYQLILGFPALGRQVTAGARYRLGGSS